MKAKTKSQREKDRQRSGAKPKHGRLRTRNPVISKRFDWTTDLLPREGRGDIRNAMAGDGVAEHPGGDPAYRSYRNGMPALKPYVYGAKRASWATAGLDMAAIRQADGETDGRKHKGRPAVFGDLIEDVLAYDDTLTAQQVSELVGCSLSAAYKYLRKHYQRT